MSSITSGSELLEEKQDRVLENASRMRGRRI